MAAFLLDGQDVVTTCCARLKIVLNWAQGVVATLRLPPIFHTAQVVARRFAQQLWEHIHNEWVCCWQPAPVNVNSASGLSLHLVATLESGRWRWHPRLRRNVCARGELLHIGLWLRVWFEHAFSVFFLHSLLEWLNPKALHWEENAEEEAAVVAVESLDSEKVRET